VLTVSGPEKILTGSTDIVRTIPTVGFYGAPLFYLTAPPPHKISTNICHSYPIFYQWLRAAIYVGHQQFPAGMTISEMVDSIAAKYPDTEAIVSVHQDIRWTYREFAERVNQVARALMGLGVERGDRVGIWAMNHAEWVVVQFATSKIGAIMVNINPAYRTYELEYVLKQAEISTSSCRAGSRPRTTWECFTRHAPRRTNASPAGSPVRSSRSQKCHLHGEIRTTVCTHGGLFEKG